MDLLWQLKWMDPDILLMVGASSEDTSQLKKHGRDMLVWLSLSLIWGWPTESFPHVISRDPESSW